MSDIVPKKLKVTELREELKTRGLDTKGNKAQLVKRLEKALKSEIGDGVDTTTSDLDTSRELDANSEDASKPVEEPVHAVDSPEEPIHKSVDIPIHLDDDEPVPVRDREPELEVSPEPEAEPEPVEPEPEIIESESEPEENQEEPESVSRHSEQESEPSPAQVEPEPEPQQPVVEHKIDETPVETCSDQPAVEEETAQEDEVMQEEEQQPSNTSATEETTLENESKGNEGSTEQAGVAEKKDEKAPVMQKGEEMEAEDEQQGEFQVMDSVGDTEGDQGQGEERKGTKRRHSRDEERSRRSRSPQHKRERIAEPMDNEDWLQVTDVVLDRYNADLNLRIGEDGCKANPITVEGFAFMWAGARTNYGVKKKKVPTATLR